LSHDSSSIWGLFSLWEEIRNFTNNVTGLKAV
jgi:hypothetical protein